MSDTKNKFYLTTPIYYVNARPHIGHAYTTIAADVIARRHRLLGDDTFLLTGTDEHGQKIQRSAEAAGIPPQQFADEVSASFQDLWKRMGITNDAFIRTTDAHHKRGAQKLFTQLQQNGFIELRSYTGQYCISDETFVDVPVGAPCPECGRLTETVTEENYFFKLSQFQKQLIDLIESNTLAIQPDSRKNEVLSFLRGNISSSEQSRVPHLRDSLIVAKVGEAPQTSPERTPAEAGILSEAKDPNPSSDVILSEAQSAKSKDPEGANPANASQTLSTPNLEHSAKGTPYNPGALKDLSISRTSVKWGIPVPGDEKHVIYVWLDALSNYMTAIGYGSEDPAEQAKFKNYWPADLHLVGKEIIRFHCVYWPAFLLALNPELKGKTPNDLPFEEHLNWAKDWLPKAITAHGWLLFEESKMSKSRGNIVRTETILDAFGTLLPNASQAALQSEESRVPHVPLLGRGEKRHRTPSEATNPGAPRPASGTWEEAPQNPPEKQEQDLFAADVLRYFLLREIPFRNDGSFSFDALVQRYNSDLANGYGNLVSRTFAMIEKYFDGVILDSSQLQQLPNVEESLQFSSSTIIGAAYDYALKVQNQLNTLDFSGALQDLWKFISLLDLYITTNRPWTLTGFLEDNLQRAEILYTAAESIRIITALLYPILPYATSKVWAQLGLGDIEQAAKSGDLKNLQWGGLKPGTKLGPLSPIFPRAPKELIQLMNDMEASNAQNAESLKSVKPSKSVVENAGLPLINNNNDASPHHRTEFAESPISSASATAALNPIAETVHPITPHHPEADPRPETPQIAIDDFIKIDLRVARIVVAERIPKADKLLRLEVDLGYERRQILSGIAQWYTPEELIGRRIVVIANLAPRKMRGLESHGMLLAASHGEDGKPVLATFAEDIALGSRLK